MFKKLAQQLKSQNTQQTGYHAMSSPMEKNKSSFLKNLSFNALNLYERKSDIKNFTRLVMSNPENDSHNKIVDELFSNGVKDPFNEDSLFALSENERFLKDLGLK